MRMRHKRECASLAIKVDSPSYVRAAKTIRYGTAPDPDGVPPWLTAQLYVTDSRGRSTQLAAAVVSRKSRGELSATAGIVESITAGIYLKKNKIGT